MEEQVHQPIPAVQVEVPVRQARDRAQYVRQQKGHSFIVGWLLLGPITCFIVPLYWSFSPNHYWHI